MSSNKKESGTVGSVKKRIGRPPSKDPKGKLRALRFTAGEDREIDAGLAVASKEFSEFARPLILAGVRREIEKARKR